MRSGLLHDEEKLRSHLTVDHLCRIPQTKGNNN